MVYMVGKCPECGEMVSRRDIGVVQLRSTWWRPHFAYVCKRCDHIMGFGSNAPW